MIVFAKQSVSQFCIVKPKRKQMCYFKPLLLQKMQQKTRQFLSFKTVCISHTLGDCFMFLSLCVVAGVSYDVTFVAPAPAARAHACR